ncbi:MAG: hypothetical protein IPJ88_07320 [Myxococcales bacterium]|nr:MAG: hypothetical protein IPJ88_07320 [Myxococcales bacterium]
MAKKEQSDTVDASAASDDPIARISFPSKLKALVSKPGPNPAIHGISIYSDLVTFYTFVEQVYFTLTARFPSPTESKVFEKTLQFLTPSHIGEAPVHAAMLARLSGTRDPSVIAIGALGLTEQAHFFVTEHVPLIEWHKFQKEPLPKQYLAQNEEKNVTANLIEAVDKLNFNIPPYLPHLKADSAALCVLLDLGLKEMWQIETLCVLSKLSGVCSEAFAHETGSLTNYPFNLPNFVYTKREADDEH